MEDDLLQDEDFLSLFDSKGTTSDTPESNYRWSEQETPDEDVTWGDYGRAGAIGTVGVGDALAGAAAYIAQVDPNDRDSLINAVRESAQDVSRRIFEGMSEQGQRSMTAGVIPREGSENIWQDDISARQALSLQGLAAMPSFAASVGIAALTRSPGAGAAAVGSMQSGAVFNDIVRELEVADEDEFMLNPQYRELREEGMEHEDAKARIIDEAVGARPLVQGLITAGTARAFGVEGNVGRLRSMPRTNAALGGAVREGAQEFVDEGSVAALTETSVAGALGRDPDFLMMFDRAATGATIGAGLGAGAGALFGGARTPDANAIPPAGEATQPGQRMDREDEALDQERETDQEQEDALPPTEEDVLADTTPPETTSEVVSEDGTIPLTDDPDADLPPRVTPTAPAAPPLPEAPAGAPAAEQDNTLAVPVGEPTTPVQLPATTQDRNVTAQEAQGIANQAVSDFDAQLDRRTGAAAPDVGQVVQPAAAPTPPVTSVPEAEAPVSVRTAMEQGQSSVRLEDGRTVLLPTTGSAARANKSDIREQQGEKRTPPRAGAKDPLPPLQVLANEGPEKTGPFKKRAERIVARDGDNAPSFYRDVVGPNGKMLDGRSKENRDRIEQARVEEFEAATEFWKGRAQVIADYRGTDRDAVVDEMEAADGKEYERLRNEFERAEEDQRVLRILQETGPKDPDAEFREVSRRAYRPLAARISRAVRAATREGIKVPKGRSDLRSGAGPNIRHLVAMREAIPKLRRGSLSPKQVQELLTLDSLARAGGARDASQTAMIEASSRGEGKLAGEAADASAPEQSSVAPNAEQLMIAREEQAEAKRSLVERAENLAEKRATTKEAVAGSVAGTDKGGTFEVVVGRRKLGTPPDVPGGKVSLGPKGKKAVEKAKSKPDPKSAASRAETEKAQKIIEGEGRAQVNNNAAAQDTAPAVTPEVRQDKPRARVDDGTALLEATAQQAAVAAAMRANPRSWSSGDARTVGGMLIMLNDTMRQLPRHTSLLYEALRDKMRPTIGNVKVYFATPENIQRSVMDDPNLVGKNIGGYYDSETNTIILSDRFRANREQLLDILMHEGLHAALQRTIDKDPTTAESLSGILDTARAAAQAQGREFYGLTDIHELVSEAFSNPEFQDFLSSIPVPSVGTQQRSLFQAFVDWAANLLGFDVDGTLLGQVIRTTDHAFGVRAQYVNAPAGIRASVIGERAKRTRSRMNSHIRNFDEAVKRMGYKVATTYKLAQDAVKNVGGRFGEAVKGVVDAYQRMGQRRTQLQDDGHRIMGEWMDWARANPEAAALATNLMYDANPLNVRFVDNWDGSDAQLLEANKHHGKANKDPLKDKADGWQSKARLRALQERYSALGPEARKQFRTVQKYLYDTQSRMTRNNVQAMMDGLAGDKLTADQREELTSKVIKGTLGQADEKTLIDVLGEDTGKQMFKALQDARALRAQVGVYAPGMRHGDFVVRTYEKLPKDLMGGQLQEGTDNVIEFRAYDPDTAKANREARAKAKKFVEATDMIVGKIRRVYIDRATGEQLSALDVSSAFDVDVVYRVPVQREGFYAFDSRIEGQDFIADPLNADRFEWDKTDKDPIPRAEMTPGQELSSTALRSILSTIEKRGNTSDEVKARAKEAAQQAALKLMPGNRIRQRSITRNNVYGASRDFTRSFHIYVEGTANYISRQEFMPEIRELEAVALKEMKENRDEKSGMRSMIYNELAARVNSSANDARDPSPFVSRILRLSFLNYLFSPAYSMVNATQPPMVSFPWMAGKFGSARSAAAMIEAYNTVGGLGVFKRGVMNTYTSARQARSAIIKTDDPFKFMMDNIAKAKDGKLLLEVIEYAAERGLISRNAGFELGRMATSGGSGYDNAVSRIERIARQLPFATEVVNRSVPLIAAYRLAKSKGQSHSDAMKTAFDITMETQGDYSATNAPPLFKHDVGRVVFQFKKYPQLMTQLLVGMFRDAFGPNATKEERRIAFRHITHFAGVQIAVAGAFSVPALELVKVPMMLAAVAGWGDGWEPYERELQEIAKETFGKPLGEMMSKGVLTRGLGQLHPSLGVDLSRRVSLAHLWTFGEPREMTDESIQAYLFGYMVGAPGSMLVGMGSGMRDAGNGDYARALSKMIPIKVFGDFAKAMGDDELDIAQRAMLTAGLQPAERSNRFDQWRGEQLERRAKRDERRDLEERWRNANARERASLRREITRYNQSVSFRERTYPWNWSQ